MSAAPDFMPVLSAGAHSTPASGACFMEMVSYLAGEEWSDHPACTHPVIAGLARRVNDCLPDSERSRLVPLLTRAMGTAGGDWRLSVQLALWCAEQVADLTAPGTDEAAAARRVTRAWLDGKATETDCRAAIHDVLIAGRLFDDATHAATYAAYAACEVAGGVTGDAESVAAAHCARRAITRRAIKGAASYGQAASTYASGDVGLLTGLIDEYDRITGRAAPAPLTLVDARRLVDLTT